MSAIIIPRGWYLWLTLTLAIVAISNRNAHADKQAEALFAQGKKAMTQKSFEAACKAFEDSQRIEPLIGTQMNIGLCYEQWGKMEFAHRAFRKAQRMAQVANDTRAPKIGDRAAAMEPSLALLQVRISDDIKKSDLAVSVDDEELIGELLVTDIAFAPGEHTLSYQIKNQPAVKIALSFRPGKRYEQTIRQTRKDGAATQGKSRPPVSDKNIGAQRQPIDLNKDDTNTERTGRSQRIVGVSLVAAGSVAMGVSAYLAYAAKKKYKNALRSNCANSTTMCDEIGLTSTQKARKDANLATVVFSTGLATALAGGIVYIISPSAHAKMEQHAVFISPQIDSTGAAVLVGGQF
jgi:tetratricopeptide (TPR) repeat protein